MTHQGTSYEVIYLIRIFGNVESCNYSEKQVFSLVQSHGPIFEEYTYLGMPNDIPPCLHGLLPPYRGYDEEFP